MEKWSEEGREDLLALTHMSKVGGCGRTWRQPEHEGKEQSSTLEIMGLIQAFQAYSPMPVK